jgi:type III secretion system low calcium response chaperone LcrH/SycD
MTAINEKEMLDKAQTLVDHLAAGGTLKTLANLGDEELEAVYSVAYNHFQAKKYDQAIDIFKFLCLYDHTEPRWVYGLAASQQEKQDYEAAINSYALATLLDVEDPKPQIQAGYCLLALERWPEAQSALEGALIACGTDSAHAEPRRQAETLLAAAKKRQNPAKTEKGK